jgi:hypothetical protein
MELGEEHLGARSGGLHSLEGGAGLVAAARLHVEASQSKVEERIPRGARETLGEDFLGFLVAADVDEQIGKLDYHLARAPRGDLVLQELDRAFVVPLAEEKVHLCRVLRARVSASSEEEAAEEEEGAG